jgi:lipoate-protein ligase A
MMSLKPIGETLMLDEKSSGTSEGRGSHKAQKGLIRVRLSLRGEVLARPLISGDFFMYPEDRLWELERDLEGCATCREEIAGKVHAFYHRSGVVTPGVSPEDFAEAVIRAVADLRKSEKHSTAL